MEPRKPCGVRLCDCLFSHYLLLVYSIIGVLTLELFLQQLVLRAKVHIQNDLGIDIHLQEGS